MTRFVTAARRSKGAFTLSALALAGTLAGLAPAPAIAASGAFYRAELASPLAAPRREILNGVIWSCAESTCTGTKGGSRAELECARLAQKVGPIAAFTKGEDMLDQTGLMRCNS